VKLYAKRHEENIFPHVIDQPKTSMWIATMICVFLIPLLFFLITPLYIQIDSQLKHIY